MKKIDVIIIGAGASGLMCAIEAGKRQRQVLVLEHANKPGKKILMSGGGRCNFTNKHISFDNYIGHNPHFHKSALSSYTQWDFIDWVEKNQIAYQEKKHGQLFCEHSAKDILHLLLNVCEKASVSIQLKTTVLSITKLSEEKGFLVKTQKESFQTTSLVIATGGLSIPTMGASPFGYEVAKQFGLKVWPTRAALVPFTWHAEDKAKYEALSGISVEALFKNQRKSFKEDMLFTHRGISGPVALQLSSYWEPGETIAIQLLPEQSIESMLLEAKKKRPQVLLKTMLQQYFPKRLIQQFIELFLLDKPLQHLSNKEIKQVSDSLQHWQFLPNGTEGYRTAEVTLGGVDTHAISSKTMEATDVPGLYFIGEVLDVTGWLGGFNFQWAWSSGWVAGQHV